MNSNSIFIFFEVWIKISLKFHSFRVNLSTFLDYKFTPNNHCRVSNCYLLCLLSKFNPVAALFPIAGSTTTLGEWKNSINFMFIFQCEIFIETSVPLSPIQAENCIFADSILHWIIALMLLIRVFMKIRFRIDRYNKFLSLALLLAARLCSWWRTAPIRSFI